MAVDDVLAEPESRELSTELAAAAVQARREVSVHVNRMIEVGRVGLEPTTDGL